jgi:hypothetical protein
MFADKTMGYKSIAFNMDKVEFYKVIYEYFGLPRGCDDAEMLVELRKTVKDVARFRHLGCKLGMSDKELLSIIHDDYPQIFNKPTNKYIKEHYDVG